MSKYTSKAWDLLHRARTISERAAEPNPITVYLEKPKLIQRLGPNSSPKFVSTVSKKIELDLTQLLPANATSISIKLKLASCNCGVCGVSIFSKINSKAPMASLMVTEFNQEKELILNLPISDSKKLYQRFEVIGAKKAYLETTLLSYTID